MQLVPSLDRAADAFDNEAMSKRAAQRVRDWRKAHGDLSQIQFAKQAGVSVGCLQGFEAATRATRDKNLDKIALAIGLSGKAELLSDDDPPAKPDPLLKDLRPEDLRFANLFHRAELDIKHAAKRLFGPDVSDEFREHIAPVLERLVEYRDDPVFVTAVVKFVTTYRMVEAAGARATGVAPAKPDAKPIAKKRT